MPRCWEPLTKPWQLHAFIEALQAYRGAGHAKCRLQCANADWAKRVRSYRLGQLGAFFYSHPRQPPDISYKQVRAVDLGGAVIQMMIERVQVSVQRIRLLLDSTASPRFLRNP